MDDIYGGDGNDVILGGWVSDGCSAAPATTSSTAVPGRLPLRRQRQRHARHIDGTAGQDWLLGQGGKDSF